nr:HipA family kinase [Caballeronia sp. LZ033]
MAYIKSLDERRLFVELLCAAIGGTMGVPCPSPLLVFVRTGNYGVTSKQGATLMFGSQAFNHPDVARPLRDRELILHNLRQAKLLELAGVFDEWIANDDRHDRQILFGSSAGPLFIDHERAMSSAVSANDSVKNWLIDEYISMMNDEDRKKVLSLLRSKAAKAHEVNLGSDLSDGIEYLSRGSELLADLTNFLAARLPELDRLLATRTQPEQGYLRVTAQA